MPRLERISEPDRTNLVNFPCLEFQTTPWTPIGKPLSQCKVALVTTAGLHLKNDEPFFPKDRQEADQSFRIIPSGANTREITQSHFSIGFDRTGIYRDLNVVFPTDRLRELSDQGVIGSLAENFYSFMGAILYPDRLINETGPEVAHRMKAESVDVVLLTPV